MVDEAKVERMSRKVASALSHSSIGRKRKATNDDEDGMRRDAPDESPQKKRKLTNKLDSVDLQQTSTTRRLRVAQLSNQKRQATPTKEVVYPLVKPGSKSGAVLAKERQSEPEDIDMFIETRSTRRPRPLLPNHAPEIPAKNGRKRKVDTDTETTTSKRARRLV